MAQRLTLHQKKVRATRDAIEAAAGTATLAELQRLWRDVRGKLRQVDSARPGRMEKGLELEKLEFISDTLWAAFAERLRERLMAAILEGAIKLFALESAFLKNRIGESLTIDTKEFARAYEDQLALRITKTTDDMKEMVAKKVTEWYVRPGSKLGDIVKDLSPSFGPSRAELIARTEITRLNSGVKLETGKRIGAAEWWFSTRQDQTVCTRPMKGPDGKIWNGCRSLHGQRFKLTDPMPPESSHPNCRCDAILVLPERRGLLGKVDLWNALSGLQKAHERTAEHDGIMIAIPVPEAVRVQEQITWPEGSELLPQEELHVTLAYLGDIDEAGIDRTVIEITCEEFASDKSALSGSLNGAGIFFETHKEGMNCVYLNFDAVGLSRMREDLIEFLEFRDIHFEEKHGFTPHITLGYYPEDAEPPVLDIDPFRVTGNQLRLAYGDDVTDYALQEVVWKLDFEETKHPRAHDGKFAPKGEGEAKAGFTPPPPRKMRREGEPPVKFVPPPPRKMVRRGDEKPVPKPDPEPEKPKPIEKPEPPKKVARPKIDEIPVGHWAHFGTDAKRWTKESATLLLEKDPKKLSWSPIDENGASTAFDGRGTYKAQVITNDDGTESTIVGYFVGDMKFGHWNGVGADATAAAVSLHDHVKSMDVAPKPEPKKVAVKKPKKEEAIARPEIPEKVMKSADEAHAAVHEIATKLKKERDELTKAMETIGADREQIHKDIAKHDRTVSTTAPGTHSYEESKKALEEAKAKLFDTNKKYGAAADKRMHLDDGVKAKVRKMLTPEHPAEMNFEITMKDATRKERARRGVEEFQRLVSHDALMGHTIIKFKAGGGGRSSYGGKVMARVADSPAVVNASSSAGVDVMVHELGHHLEAANPDISKAALEFFERRTKGEKATWLGGAYAKKEIAKRDKFFNAYCGKVYPFKYWSGNKATEIISMGLQQYYDNPLEFSLQDPEYFKLIFNATRGSK